MKQVLTNYIVRPPNLEEYKVTSYSELIDSLLESNIRENILDEYYNDKEDSYNQFNFMDYAYNNAKDIAEENGYIIERIQK